MRTRFHIEKRRDEYGKLLSADRPVLMSVTFSGNRIILGTGVKVDLNGWKNNGSIAAFKQRGKSG